MVISARFASICPRCSTMIEPGSPVNWERGSHAEHVECPTIAAVEETDYVDGCQHCTQQARPITVRPGTFTVVGIQHTRRTFRIAKPREIARRDGRMFVKLLTGSSNETDYTYVGFVTPDHARFIWSRDISSSVRASVTGTALDFLLYADDESRRDAGRTYALESGNCYVCGRLLTVPSSIDAGIGPVCEGRQ